MSPKTSFIAIAFLASSLSGQDTLNYPTIGEIVRFSPHADKLLSPEAAIEVISSGYVWSEGPAWNSEENFLAFSDVHQNRTHKWVTGEGASLWIEPSGYTGPDYYSNSPGGNGMAFDRNGNLFTCEQGDRRISILKKGQGKQTVADGYKGRRFNSPNDIAIAKDGTLYITDPFYGLPQKAKDPSREIDFMGVFAIRPNGEVELVDDRLSAPNGIALSPDEKTLYVANSNREREPIIYSYPINKYGSLGKRSVHFDARNFPEVGPANPDGMKTDKMGNLWIGAIIGLLVIDPEGQPVLLAKTGEKTSNCVFGDDGFLYITADTYICRLQTKTQGNLF